MKRRVQLAVAFLSACSLVLATARADEKPEKHQGKPTRNEPQQRPTRAPPPKFQPHPPGTHPEGSKMQQHSVRVLAPKAVTRHGGRGWAHWGHPDFDRPAYYWNWGIIHSVSCVAEDSYGDQYPVSEAVWRGFGIADMTTVEDDALDRCYAESGGDNSCYLLTCSHY